MATYWFTGTLGAGKSLCAVGKIQEALRAGRRVATNMNVFPEQLVGPRNRMVIHRLSDFPRFSEFEALGRGCEDAREEGRFGLIVLDEAATYLNAREWNNSDRARVVAWMRMARKLGWNIIFISQDVESVDAQIRRIFDDYVVSCARLDRLAGVILRWGAMLAAVLAFIGGLWFGGWWQLAAAMFAALAVVARVTDCSGWMPRIHVATVRYKKTVVARWSFRGQDVQDGYDTGQVMDPEQGPYSILSAWHVKGRYLCPVDWPLFLRTFWFRWLWALHGAAELVPRRRVVRRSGRVSVPVRDLVFG